MSAPPNIAHIHNTQRYVQTFAILIEWNIFILSNYILGLLLLVLLIRMLIAKCLKKKQFVLHQEQPGRERRKSIEDKNNIGSKKDLNVIELKQVKSQTQKTLKQAQQDLASNSSQIYKDSVFWQIKSFSVTTSMVRVLLYVYFAFLAWSFQNIYMFGLFGRYKIMDLVSVVVVFTIMSLPSMVYYKITLNVFVNKHQSSKQRLMWMSLRLLFAIFIMTLSKDVCVCQYNSYYGTNIIETSSVSTGLSRLLTIPQVCQDYQICHLYATLPQDCSTSVFLNAHSGLQLSSLRFDIKLKNSLIKRVNSSDPYRFDNVEAIGRRFVHSVLITGLNSSTHYQIQIYDNNGNLLNATTYRTLPDTSTEELRIIVGGDVGQTEQGKRMTSYVVAYDPDVIILGGDLAYDNGIRNCYYSWDILYGMFENANRKLNRLVPLILSVGNHDVGFDALAWITVEKSDEQIPLFFAFNPQHTTTNDTTIPPLNERETTHYHKIGPTLMLNLDSGYLQTYEQQTYFIREVAETNKGLFLFANYHNPIYPSCTNLSPESEDMTIIKDGLKYWVPLFDEFNFTTVMEHHTHFKKFTYPMRNNSISHSFGTRYVGDGSWGVTDMECPKKQTAPRLQIMQHYANINANHFWLMTLSKTNSSSLSKTNSSSLSYSLNYTAIDLQGNAVFTQTDDLYLPTL